MGSLTLAYPSIAGKTTQEQLESAMDTIRGKYGRDAIAFGRGGKVGWNKDE